MSESTPGPPLEQRRAEASARLWKQAEEVLSPEEAAALRQDAEVELADDQFLQKVMKVMAQGCEVQHGAEALWVLGPSGAGKSHALECNYVDKPAGALTLDGGFIRESSEAWARAMNLAESQGLAGFSNYFKDYFKAPCDKVKAEVVHRAVSSRANVVVPDTASNFKHTTSMLSKFLDAGYRVSCKAVYSDRATCEARGRLRESEEGKKFSSTNWPTSVQSILDMQALLQTRGLLAAGSSGVEVLDNTGVLHRKSLQQIEERLSWHRGAPAAGCCWAECRLLAGVYRAEGAGGDGRLFQVLPLSLTDENPAVQMLVIEGRDVLRALELRLCPATCALRPAATAGGGAAGWQLRLGARGRPCLRAEEGAEYPSLTQVSPIPGWSLGKPVEQDDSLLESLGGLDFCSEGLRDLSEEELRLAGEAARLDGLRGAPSREQPRALVLLAPSAGGKSTVSKTRPQMFDMRVEEAVLVESSPLRDVHAQYRAILHNGQANKAIWYRAWPSAKDVLVAGKKKILNAATAAKKDVVIADTGSDLAKLLSSISKLKEQGYIVHLCGIFADPHEILARGIAREVEDGKRYNRDARKLCTSFDAFAPAIRQVNGRFCLIRNSQGFQSKVYCEGEGGQQIDFNLEEALHSSEPVTVEEDALPQASCHAEETPIDVYLPPQDLAYLVEGNTNVVCAYQGSLEDWQGCALRCRKADNSSYRGDCRFARRVATRMLGAEYVDPGHLVGLSAENVKSINKALFSCRPPHRQSKALDAKVVDKSGKVLALRMQNLTAPPVSGLLANVVTVELKPKCGLTERPGLPSRFQLFQQQKLLEGKVSRASAYDPVKLLSKQRHLVHEALQAALADPQNNLRIFLDGRLAFSQEVEDPSFDAKLIEAGLQGKDGLLAQLADILASPPMALPERLKRIQAWAAGETSHLAKQLYGTLRAHVGSRAANDLLACTESFELAVEGFEACPCDESGITLAVSQMNAVHMLAHSTEWGPDVERQVIQMLCRFLLGRTAHDVSLLLSLVRLPEPVPPELQQQLEACRFVPLSSLGLSSSLVHEGFWLRASVVDTDAKSASKIPEYATQLDEAAAAYYHRFEASDEATATAASGHEAVGGHVGAMRFEGDVVWKRDQGGRRGCAELGFLRWALEEPNCVGIIPGLVGYRREGGAEGWLAMQNILHGLKEPAILDLKLGTRTWNTTAIPKKADSARQKAASSTTGSLGVRVVGGRLRNLNGDFCKVGHKAERDIKDEDGLREVLSEFLCSEALRESAMKKVHEINAWWAQQESYAFYSSSLLLACDTKKKDECRIRLIDFANCERITEKSQDLSGVAFGFETLTRLLASLAPLR